MSNPYEDFVPNPFAAANPFLFLHASPLDAPGDLTRKAAARQLRAGDADEELAVRDALRQLTTDPDRRAAWEMFTPHAATVAPSPNLDRATAALARLLLGAELPDGEGADALARFAAFLGWDKRAERVPGAIPEATARRWWEITTQRFAARWDYWHQLALVYHRHAQTADDAATRGEAACSRGDQADAAEPPLLAAYWARAYGCWAKAVESGLAAAVSGHVEPLVGFDRARFAALADGLVPALAEIKAKQAEAAVRTRNRLAAARHRRWLAARASRPELKLFAPHAGRVADHLEQDLWRTVRRLKGENDWPGAFDELDAGLLLFRPDDLEVVTAGVEAIAKSGIQEYAGGTFATTAAMAARFVGPADRLAKHVFAGSPRQEAVSPTATNIQKVGLHWCLNLQSKAAGGMPLGATRRMLAALEADLNETG